MQDGSISELNIMPLHKREMLKLFRQTGIFLHPGIPGYLYTCIRTLKKASIKIRDASKHNHYILHTHIAKASPNALTFTLYFVKNIMCKTNAISLHAASQCRNRITGLHFVFKKPLRLKTEGLFSRLLFCVLTQH